MNYSREGYALQYSDGLLCDWAGETTLRFNEVHIFSSKEDASEHCNRYNDHNDIYYKVVPVRVNVKVGYDQLNTINDMVDDRVL